MKATTNIIPKNGHLLYDLEVKNYKDLIKTNVGTPRILVVYSMPKERAQWLNVQNDSTILQHCAWWCSLRGLPDTTSKHRKRISIPENQRLTCEELRRLVNMVKGGAEL